MHEDKTSCWYCTLILALIIFFCLMKITIATLLLHIATAFSCELSKYVTRGVYLSSRYGVSPLTGKPSASCFDTNLKIIFWKIFLQHFCYCGRCVTVGATWSCLHCASVLVSWETPVQTYFHVKITHELTMYYPRSHYKMRRFKHLCCTWAHRKVTRNPDTGGHDAS